MKSTAYSLQSTVHFSNVYYLRHRRGVVEVNEHRDDLCHEDEHDLNTYIFVISVFFLQTKILLNSLKGKIL